MFSLKVEWDPLSICHVLPGRVRLYVCQSERHARRAYTTTYPEDENKFLRKNRSTTGVFYFFHYHTMCHYRNTRRGCTLRHAIAVSGRPNDGDDGVKRTVHWARITVIPRSVRDPPTRGTSVGSAATNHDRGITAGNGPCRKSAARRPEPCFYRQTTWSSSRQRRIAWCTRYGTVRHARFKYIGRTRGSQLDLWGGPGHTG